MRALAAAQQQAMLNVAPTGAAGGMGALGTSEEGGALSEVDFVTLLTVTRKSLIWIVLLLIMSLAGAQLFIRYTRPLYQSMSIIKFDEESEANQLGLSMMGGPISDRAKVSRLGGEVELIKSEMLFTQLKDSLDMRVSYFAEGTVLESELYSASPFKITYQLLDRGLFNQKFDLTLIDSKRITLQYKFGGQTISGEYRVGEPIKAPGIIMTVALSRNFVPESTDQNYHFVVNSDASLSQYLNLNLQVQVLNPDANTITISFTDHSPLKAHDIVKSITALYRATKIAKSSQSTAQTLAFLDGQIVATNDSLRQVERQMQQFVKSAGSFDVKSELPGIITSLTEELQQRVALQNQLNQLETVQRTLDRQGDLTQTIVLLNDPLTEPIREELNRLNQLQLQRQLVGTSYRDNTAVAQRLNAQYDHTRATVSQYMTQVRRQVTNSLNQLNERISQLNGRMQEMPREETELTRLGRRVALFEKFVLDLLTKKVEYQIVKAGTTPDFQILSAPTIPSEPVYPEKFIIYVIGAAIGLVMGMGLIAGRYFSHNTVTSIRELELNSLASVLGMIPSYTKEKMLVSRLVVDKNPKSAISESIRSIRTNLEFLGSVKNRKKLISVTSTISGEGKTFVAVNLGGIIAQADQKVLLLDLDMRKPKVHLAFEADNQRGMSTLLIDKHTIAECVQKSAIDTFDFISAGPTPPNPSELLLSPRFDEILNDLHQIYDVIIIDTPPVGLVTDGILIMRKVDIPIYIVRAGYSRKVFLKNINKIIRQNGFTHLCTILNDARSGGLYGYGYGYGYSYGYGYGYGNGYGYYEEVEPKKAEGGLLSGLRSRLSNSDKPSGRAGESAPEGDDDDE